MHWGFRSPRRPFAGDSGLLQSKRIDLGSRPAQTGVLCFAEILQGEGDGIAIESLTRSDCKFMVPVEGRASRLSWQAVLAARDLSLTLQSKPKQKRPRNNNEISQVRPYWIRSR